jgi:ribosome modulation factor
VIDRRPESLLSTHEIEAAARDSTRALAVVAEAEAAERRALANGYRLCVACRVRLVAAELCPHHTTISEQERVAGWAEGNRIWCEFVHGKWPARQQVAARGVSCSKIRATTPDVISPPAPTPPFAVGQDSVSH